MASIFTLLSLGTSCQVENISLKVKSLIQYIEYSLSRESLTRLHELLRLGVGEEAYAPDVDLKKKKKKKKSVNGR